jgi:hypothetical protein
MDEKRENRLLTSPPVQRVPIKRLAKAGKRSTSFFTPGELAVLKLWYFEPVDKEPGIQGLNVPRQAARIRPSLRP